MAVPIVHAPTRFRELSQIGKGSFGTALLCEDQRTGTKVSVAMVACPKTVSYSSIQVVVKKVDVSQLSGMRNYSDTVSLVVH